MTRTQIGDVLQESNGDEYHVYLDRFRDEEPDALVVDGEACNLVFDPGTVTGRAQALALITRLTVTARTDTLPDVDVLHTMAREWLAIAATLPTHDGPELVGPRRVWELAARELADAIGRPL